MKTLCQVTCVCNWPGLPVAYFRTNGNAQKKRAQRYSKNVTCDVQREAQSDGSRAQRRGDIDNVAPSAGALSSSRVRECKYDQVAKSKQGQIVHHMAHGGFDEEFLMQHPVSTLNWCILTLGSQGKVEVAEQLFHWMRLKGTANEHSLIKLFEAYESSRTHPSRAVKTWRNVSRMQCPFSPGFRSSAALLKTFRPYRDVRGALRIFNEMKRRQIPMNHYAYNTMIRIAAESGDLETAMDIESQLREDPGLQTDVRTYSSLMQALGKTGRWSHTKIVHDLLESQGMSLDETLGLQLISGYAKCGMPAAAEGVLEEMMSDKTGIVPNRLHWNALLDAYATSKQYDRCLEAYSRMTDASGVKPDSYTMVALLKAGKGSHIGRPAVKFVLEELNKYRIGINVELCSSAISCCRSQWHASKEEAKLSAELANRIWGEMLAAKVQPNKIAYNTLLAARADADDIHGVKDLFQAFEEDSHVEPDEATWRILIRAFEQSEEWSQDLENILILRKTWETLHEG